MKMISDFITQESSSKK